MADTTTILKQAEQLFKSGKADQARVVLQRGLQRSPNDADLNSCMCFVLQRMGQMDQAMHFGTRALALRPNDTAFVLNLANIFGAGGRHAEAVDLLERVVAANPSDPGPWSTLSSAYFLSGLLAKSEEAARRGLALHPNHPRITEQLSAAIRKWGRCREMFEVMRDASLAHPEETDLAHEAAFNSNYPSGVSTEEVFEVHKRFGAVHMARARRMKITEPTPADAERPLRVGFMSPDFKQHSVAYYAEPLIENLDRAQFSVYLYSLCPKADEVTERFKRLAQGWCSAASMYYDALAERIVFDKIDILIDLGGLTGGTRPHIYARKPAPVQATYLGYPNTMGLPTIDYRLIDCITDPPGAERFAVERLVRLDPCFLCFRPPREAPSVAPPPMLKNGFVTFGSFNAGMKFSDQCVALWARVLKSSPGSRLVLKNFDLSMPEVREFLGSRFEREGVEAARIEMISYAPSTADHLGLYARVDIGLDTFPYHGTTTTCEAFHMGVPVISLEGGVHASRVGCTLLHAVGLPELIARSEEEFVRIAAGLAGDWDRVAAIRASLRERQARSPLGDEKGFASRFGAALREMWRARCKMAMI